MKTLLNTLLAGAVVCMLSTATYARSVTATPIKLHGSCNELFAYYEGDYSCIIQEVNAFGQVVGDYADWSDVVQDNPINEEDVQDQCNDKETQCKANITW
jgi:hypothetical protein